DKDWGPYETAGVTARRAGDAPSETADINTDINTDIDRAREVGTMNKRIKITSARKGSVVYENNHKTPFWIRHLPALIIVGVLVLIGVIIALVVTDWGRAS